MAHITGTPPDDKRCCDDSHPFNALRRSSVGNGVVPIAINKAKSADKSCSDNKYVIAYQRNQSDEKYKGASKNQPQHAMSVGLFFRKIYGPYSEKTRHERLVKDGF
ncbi:MAG: hypothetical protein ACHP8B_08155 [Terriglobales bacterium]